MQKPNTGTADRRFPASRRGFLKGSVAAGLLLAGPNAGFAETEVPKKGGHLKLGLGGGASSDVLDPAGYTSTIHLVLARSWGDTVVETDPLTGKLVPALAESWESSDNAAVWTFKIRKGVLFHDGKELVAEDVAQTLRRHSDKASKSGALGYLESFKSIEASGDTVTITLSERNADLPLILTVYNLVIQPNGGLDNPNAGIGTGPYKVANFDPGVRVLMEKNKDDWRADRGHVDSVELIVMNDTSARTAAVSSGQVHFIDAVNPKTIPLIERAGSVQILNTTGRGHYTLPMLVDKAPFDNNDLRLALKYAIDRQSVLDTALGGYGTIGNDFPVNSAFDYFPSDIEQRAYDPDKAAFHFKKSGFDGVIPLDASDVMPGGVDMAVLFQDSAAKAGIKIDVRRVPTDGYWTNVWRVQPFCISYWGSRLTQDLIYSIQQYSGAASNETNFKDPKFDGLMKEARAETDEAKRKDLYHEMALIVRDEGGSIIPVFNNYLNAASKTLKGFVHDVGNDLSNGYVVSRVWLDA